MAITLTIGGSSRDVGYLIPGSEWIRRTVKGRSTATFTLRSDAGTVLLNDSHIGAAVVLSDGTLSFTGTIDSFRTRLDFPHDRSQLVYEVSCQDTNPFDRRIVSRRYPAGSIWKNIIWDIVDNFLDGEGITKTNVDGFGFIQEALEFDYRTVREAFNTLTDISGEDWWCIGSDLYFKAVGSARPSAAFNLTGSSGNWVDLEIERGRSRDYRNRQFLRTKVRTQTGSITDSATGNGVLYFFPTQFPMTDAPTVTVGGVAQTVYETGVDAAGQNGWYWFRGGAGVIHGQSTPVGNGVTIAITYNGYDSSVIMVKDDAAITARAAAEGGSGKWDMLDEARDIDNLEMATQLADGLLSRRGSLPKTIRYRTRTSGLVPGVKQNVNISKFGINGDYYVTDIESSAVVAPHSTQFFWHTVTLALLLDRSDWTKWWHEWWSRTKSGRIDSGLGGDTSAGGGNNSASWYHQIPSGTKNGSNTVFTLTYTPVQPDIAQLFLNGILQTQNGVNSSPPTADFTLSGNTITYTDAPLSTDWHEIWYLRGPGSSTPMRARQFAGGTAKINWGTDDDLRITGNWSFGAWIKLSSSSTGAICCYGDVGVALDATTAIPYYVSVGGTSGAWDIRVGHDSATTNYTNLFNTNLSNDTAYYIGVSRDSSAKTVKLYIGTGGSSVTLIDTWSYAENPPSTAGSAAGNELWVGNCDGTSVGFNLVPFVGTIQEHYIAAAVWSSDDHVAAMGGNPPTSNVRLLAPMLGVSPEDDASANDFSGAVTGTTVTQVIH